ncbi:MAG: peptidyl-prolyl cis-trans isomerase [Phycisphaeraceae bacterium]
MRHTPTRRPATAALLAAAIASTPVFSAGCASWFGADADDTRAAVKPEDFVGEPRPVDRADEPGTPTTLVATDVTEDDAQDEEGSGEQPKRDAALAVNAMVGHINGEAVYADQVFDINVAAQLANYGRRFSENDFLKQAAIVIEDKLRTIIKNKLILGEAERNLEERQRMGINRAVQSRREELIRYHGEGSLSLAKARFLESTGQTLEDHLVEYREQLLTNSYIGIKVRPKIVVNDRDIEQWYASNLEQYQQPDRRSFRIIRVKDTADARAVVGRLERGEAFEDVASDAELNLYNAAGAGLFNQGEPLAGERVYGIEPVNDALIKLQQGEHAGPILAGEHQYFVQLVELIPGENRTLQDPEVQFEIRRILELRQFEKHANRFTADLVARGSYTDETEMKVKLLEIAYARYKH